ncbi:hypothetical protein [Flavobacterium flavigenum]|uniref:hypothetical protein n=1 Tax=Flavobacterium flavigenum TaxID=3003258 RepID=UPI0022AC341F|nr:hypothetical protein [Flavobacterium flavigenum]
MKKLFLITLLITNLAISQNKQEITFEENYNKLIENLSNENWDDANKLTYELLTSTEKVDTMRTEKKVLRYIYIYTTAGLLNSQKLTKDQAIDKVKFLKSKEMRMPAHPFNSKCYVNCTHLKEDEKDTFFTGVNNTAGTQIFSFEYVKIKEGIKESSTELEGKYIALEGVLNEISVEGNMLPRFKLKFINGKYNLENP